LTTAQKFIDGMNASGGTVLLPGLKKAVSMPSTLPRVFIVITDGEIAETKEMLELAKENCENTRIFCIGIGSDTDRVFLGRMASFSRATVEYVNDNCTELDLQETILRCIKFSGVQPCCARLSSQYLPIEVKEGKAPVTEWYIYPKQKITIANIFEGVKLSENQTPLTIELNLEKKYDIPTVIGSDVEPTWFYGKDTYPVHALALHMMIEENFAHHYWNLPESTLNLCMKHNVLGKGSNFKNCFNCLRLHLVWRNEGCNS
jgi:hypothetical protein